METQRQIGARCRVLTMDGGPSPLLQIRLLAEIERRYPGFLERTDVFAGTSDGSLITLFLAAQLTRKKKAPQIFEEAIGFANGIVHALDATWCGLARLVLGYAAMDRGERFRKLLSAPENFGDLYMTDLDRRAMVVTFDAFSWEPRYFRNFSPFCERRVHEDPRGPKLVSAALASSAFPMFLPIHYGPGKRHFVDGGLVANNPAMCALVSAAEHLRALSGDKTDSIRPWLDRVCLFSLGATESEAERHATTRPPKTNERDEGNEKQRAIDHGAVRPDESNAPRRDMRHSKERMKISRWPDRDIDWGWMQWLAVRPMFLINTMLQASSNAVTQQCNDLLGPQHHRYGPSMGEIAAALGIMLAPPGKVISELDKRANEIIHGKHYDGLVFAEALRWVESFWMKDHPDQTTVSP